MPIISSAVFDDTGKPYEVSRILTKDYHFDHEAYTKYSKVYLPITYVLSYGVQFASLSALVTHTLCWHGQDIWQQSKQSLAEDARESKNEYQPVKSGVRSKKSTSSTHSGRSTTERYSGASVSGEDVHCRLMHRYEDAPISWYLATFVAMLAIGIFVVEYYPVYLPWYGLLLALSITALLFIPVGIVMAITNQHSSLYLICQLICGFVFPGRPVANMVSIRQLFRLRATSTNIVRKFLGLRHILLHLLRPRNQIRLRPQTRPLHENPAPTPLQGPNRRHPRLQHRSDRRPELDVHLHPQHLHSRSNQRLHLPHRPCPFQRFHPLGRSRPATLLRRGRPLPTSDLGLPNRLHRASPDLARRPPRHRRERMAQNQPPRPLRQSELDTARHRPQLLRLGTRLFPLQLALAPARSGLVGEIHNDAFRGAGFGAGVRSPGGVLWLLVSGVGMVGEAGVVGDEGLQGGV